MELMDAQKLYEWPLNFFSVIRLHQLSPQGCAYTLLTIANITTMGDGSLIVPATVHKIILTTSGVAWGSRDKKLHLEHRYVHCES